MLGLVAPLSCNVQRSTGSRGTQQRTTPEVQVGLDARSPSSTQATIADTGASSAHADLARTYDLNHPARTWFLPDVLKEVSDIALLSENEIACVEDEHGLVYVYDLSLARVTDKVHFASKGDYEGLAVAGQTVFVLRSDGKLFELANLKHHTSTQTHDLHLPIAESEGLCYDAARGRLLIAPKSKNQSVFGKDIRPIFAFDLKQRVVAEQPALEINLRDIRRFAKRHDLPVLRQADKDGKGSHSALRFVPSAIAMNPKSGDMFVLSSADHVLISCTTTGEVTGYALLDPELFRQPEGIAFFPNGDMLISNEASGQRATLLLFRCKGQDC